eukprot:TRINITY_DN9475_c1_g1_i6.p1 TRINITY_DN9475_c1_g1~~TRINITY_DN9475_c1_g1_i6.p1  ORF type:complete len:251 (-),score=47.55 TRINITY_DN9475_c1_g1_i6:320-1072(-)
MQGIIWSGKGSHTMFARRRTVIRSAIKQQQKKTEQFIPPPAPPAPPVVPPPPPPPETPISTEKGGGEFPTRRDLLLLFLVGGGVWWWRIQQDFPGKMYTMDDIEDMMVYQTPKGVLVAVWQDEAGRFQLLDQAGNFYYDSGDDNIGVIMVDPDGVMTNMYVDENTKEYTEKVMGNIKDIELRLIDRVGNLEFKEPVYVAGFKDKTLPVFDPRGPLPSVVSEDQMRLMAEVKEKSAEQEQKNTQVSQPAKQ